MTRVQLGSERFLSNPGPFVGGSRVGLLTNPSGMDVEFRSTIDCFIDHSDIELVALFGPEHGVRGEAQAGEHVSAAHDTKTGLPVYSLYGNTRSPTAEMLDGVDVIVIDLQDIGVRFTTYISTLAHLMTACAAHGTGVIILDRPNPLGGSTVRGNILEEAFESFVGIHALPILHGLTIGEFGRLWARDKHLPEPEVIEMNGWERSAFYDQLGVPWVLPSPNLPTLDSVLIYPATCLIEGTNLSEGRGTTRPFEMFGAPWIEPDTLVDELRRLDFAGLGFRPVFFTPAFSKHAGERCGGVQVYVTNRLVVESVEFGVTLLRILGEMAPDHFSWLPPTHDRYYIDLLCGTDQVRRQIDAGTSMVRLMARWNEDSQAFKKSRNDILLY